MTNILRKPSLTLTFVVILVLAGCSDSNIPSNQSTFNYLHKSAVKRYSDASNDIQYKEVWERRENEVCEKSDGVMTDWIGVVGNVGRNRIDTGESANINIRISATKSYLFFRTSAVNVQTLLGSVSDAGAAVRLGTNPNTSIVKGTPLYGQITSLKEGDKVKFSGQLIKDNVPGACFYETSLSMNGKIRWPEYVARFTSITKIDENEKSDSAPAVQSVIKDASNAVQSGNKDASNADQSGKNDASNADACIDKKLDQVRKEIGPDAVISRAIITEIEESCGGKI
jgi:hypothetical protein